jgi:anthranilate phosphoribosyltransferase
VSTDLTWSALLTGLIAGNSLPAEQAAWAMGQIMDGDATPAQIAAFAVLLRAKGETPEELSGLVRTMRDRATPVRWDGVAVDIVGAGGDMAHTVNISTMAALVVAGSGRTVVKHGNRAASSSCGTADVLEELGVAIDLPAEGVQQTIAEVGIGFCFAPVFHAGMRHAGGPRRELATPTFFNFLGPLTNPARVRAAAIGCADPRMAPLMAQVLADRGDTSLVFRGDDGLDELTTTTTSTAWVVRDGRVRQDVVDPSALGLAAVPPEALRGGDKVHNAAVVRDVLAGRGGAVTEAVLLNAAAGIAAHDGAAQEGGLGSSSLHDALSDGLQAATESVESGAAAELLESWIKASQHAKN